MGREPRFTQVMGEGLRAPSDVTLGNFPQFAGWGVGGSRKGEVAFSARPNAYAYSCHRVEATVLTGMFPP
jgi:hypothetical protein